MARRRQSGPSAGQPDRRSLLPWGLARVSGDSMRPGLQPGDRLLVRYDAAVRPGDVVVARFVDGTVVVKRATDPRPTRTGATGWWLLSDAPDVGVDSRHRGVVPADAVIGVVRARLWPRPRRV
ncbi:S24/S26 family peptidase [Nocardioides zeae]|uniref:Peptidase S24 n=1 Tax=Nocardioides zeae TaxID=1457234 RepID=A0A6P0HCM1_9ACTN|nr:S24/S26 family peptidase [Nocardioides zeae]NEN76689.1 peptidase S24 [Nocardioides zeae]